MKFIKSLKQLICKHKWKELPRFVNLRMEETDEAE